MLFAHLKRILKLDRLRLRGPRGARDEFLLAATAQNLRKMAMLMPTGAPPWRHEANAPIGDPFSLAPQPTQRRLLQHNGPEPTPATSGFGQSGWGCGAKVEVGLLPTSGRIAFLAVRWPTRTPE